MNKVKQTDLPDDKVKFEIKQSHSLVIIVLGSMYSVTRTYVPSMNGELELRTYPETIMDYLANMEDARFIVLPKVKKYHDSDDNSIEVYEVER